MFIGSKTMLFLTGYSGSGKSTIAESLEKKLGSYGIAASVLDGDEIRKAFGNDLPHGVDALETTTHRLIQLSLAHFQTKQVVVTAFVSPKASLRQRVKNEMASHGILCKEVFVQARLESCAKRDPKGLYKKLEDGENIRLAGINVEYEIPKAADIQCDTDTLSVEQTVSHILEHLKA